MAGITPTFANGTRCQPARVIDLVVPKIDGYDERRNILFLEAKF